MVNFVTSRSSTAYKLHPQLDGGSPLNQLEHKIYNSDDLESGFDYNDNDHEDEKFTTSESYLLPSPNNSRRRWRLRLFALPVHLQLQFQLPCFISRRVLIYRTLLSVPLVLGFTVLLFLLCGGIPPDFQSIRDYEQRLPQHRWRDAREGIATGRFLRFPGHVWGHGLNNVLQEAIVMAHLAERTNRSFVFEDYTWSRSPLPFTLYDYALRPSRMPLNAFVGGPIAGGPDYTTLSPQHHHHNHHDETGNEKTNTTLPAVSERYWQVVCPKEMRVTISTEDAPRYLGGKDLVDWWVNTLDQVRDEKCVEIDSAVGGKEVFDRYFFGSRSILSLVPSLLDSPILKSFVWSPLVRSAVTRNFAILPPSPPSSPSSSSSSAALLPTHPSDPPFSGLIAIHIRRGDYTRHCPRLAHWGSEYLGANQHPALVDRFEVPEGEYEIPEDAPPEWGRTRARAMARKGVVEDDDDVLGVEGDVGDGSIPAETDLPSTLSPYHSSHANATEIEETYTSHCLPTPSQVVSKLRVIRAVHPRLKSVYVMTNARAGWLGEVYRLLREDGWGIERGERNAREIGQRREEGEDESEEKGTLASSHDLILDREQRYVNVAVDMAIATRAEVFLGNGFSSLTSNVVLLRMARGFGAETNRFF